MMGYVKNIHLIIFILLFGLGAFSAHAQDYELDQLLDDQRNEEKQSPASVEDIPDEYIDEAMIFNGECQSTPHLNNYYDCDCLSSKFLDGRIKRGPNINKSSILLKIEGQCKNASNAAGTQYTKCMTTYFTLPKNIPAEEYCSCFANTYAKIYARTTAKPSSKLTIAIHQRAGIACRNPDLAKRLYPEISGFY